MRVRVDGRALQRGDVIDKFRWRAQQPSFPAGVNPWIDVEYDAFVVSNDASGIMVSKTMDLKNPWPWHSWPLGEIEVEVERPGAHIVTTHPLAQGKFTIADTPPVAKKLKDWPLDCPRCRRPESAYLGLNQYDCKHGCYK